MRRNVNYDNCAFKNLKADGADVQAPCWLLVIALLLSHLHEHQRWQARNKLAPDGERSK